ncbi:hypothetical protein AXG89_33160 (plasmid) [Burkholderia sp. PAMC 26561]|nr:hypothetical protein AXG89_33160 [Burkholderia sp. PAMC 26561]
MFGLYPAGSDWIRTFASEHRPAREIQKSLVDHAGFTAAIFHQPFGEHRGAVIAQSGKVLVMSATAPGICNIAVTPTVELQHLLWSYREGYATQWSAMEIRTLTGHSGWDELLISARREFAKVCDLVSAAIDGTLSAPRLPEPVAVSAVGTVHDAFPDDDNDGFYAQWVEMSHQASELPPCAH